MDNIEAICTIASRNIISSNIRILSPFPTFQDVDQTFCTFLVDDEITYLVSFHV